MKRFIRYIYEYRNGKRVQNAGFVKVEESRDSTVIQIYGKGFPASGMQELEIFLFYLFGKQVVGIPWGSIQGIRPMMAYRIEYCPQMLGGQELYDAISGIILRQKTNGSYRYYAAFWEEETAEVESMILREELLRRQEPEDATPEEQAQQEIPFAPEEQAQQEIPFAPEESEPQVYKITRKDIVNLPRQEWKLANNHFLVHGCRNFHHLISFEKDGICWLGVPGIYHKQEEQAAKAFGFGQFMKPDEGDVMLTSEEMTEQGEFGYWCRKVHRVIKG